VAYHDDLLQQAFALARRERRRPKQASLRRAVSSAYYALFHLLVAETVRNWRNPEQRPSLGRSMDHRQMKVASNRLRNMGQNSLVGKQAQVTAELKLVASAFTQLQERRHIADYDNAYSWTRTEALRQIESAERAFAAWRKIRKERIAQDFLLSLLVKNRD
jgi:uncharacterized protein (UPF0332 family)